MKLQAKTTTSKNARKTRLVNLTKTKRKRNPCADNDPGSARRAVSVRIEPNCAEYAERDPVTLEPINANAAICAGKTCWDYDSFVDSIRKESENRAGAAFRDPLTRNLVDIRYVARARPAGASTTVEETIAPVQSDAALDPEFQTNVDAGNTQNRDLEPEDEAIYREPEDDSDSDDDSRSSDFDNDYDSDLSDSDVSDSDEETTVNQMVTERLQHSRRILDHFFRIPDWRPMRFIREQLEALIVVSYSSPRDGPISDWADVGAAGFEYQIIGVDVPAAHNSGVSVQTTEEENEECNALLRVLKRLLQLYGLAEFELGNRETGPKWTCSPRTIELEQIYTTLDALRRKQEEVGKRIKSIIVELNLYPQNASVSVIPDLSSTGWIGLVGQIEQFVLDNFNLGPLEQLVLDNFNLGPTGRGHNYNIRDVTHMKDQIPLPLRLALLDEAIGINTGPNTKATLATLKRPSNTGKELCSAERTTFHRHPVTQDYAPPGFAWVSIDCWRGPKVPATLIEGYYLKPRGG